MTIHRRPGATRAARRRRQIIAELTNEFLGEPSPTERYLISTAADLILKEEALSAAFIRGEGVDTCDLVKLAGLLRRTLVTIRARTNRRKSDGLLHRIAARQNAAA
jgi:hypothetical protein